MTTELFNDNTDLFGADSNNTGVNEEPVNIPEDDPLSVFVGEGKKYKTTLDLAKAVVEKDSFIKRLQSEGAELRATLHSTKKVEEAVNQLLASQKKAPAAPSPSNQPEDNGDFEDPNSNNTKTTPTKQLTEDDINHILEKREAEYKAASNLEETKNLLLNKFGTLSAAQEAIKETAKNIGESPEFFKALARKNPKALMEMLGAHKPVDRSAPSSLRGGDISNDAFGRASFTDRTEKFYEHMKKTNPSVYFTPKVQKQRHDDAIRLGQAFFN